MGKSTPFHASWSCGALRCARIVCRTGTVRFSPVEAILFYDPFVNGHLAPRRNRTHVYRLQVGGIPTMLAGLVGLSWQSLWAYLVFSQFIR